MALSPWSCQPAAAECKLALALALDISASVDNAEYDLQLEGLAAAIEHPLVVEAILTPEEDHIEAAVFEWSGYTQQDVIIAWTRLDNADAVREFATRLRAHGRPQGYLATAIGKAVEFGGALLRSAPACRRRVLDVSGDGINNIGVPPAYFYRRGDLDGAIVNGLVILGALPDPLPYYQTDVIFGPGGIRDRCRWISGLPACHAREADPRDPADDDPGGEMRLLRQILAAAGIGLAPGLAQACALELILAVDVSGSIDAQEFALQNEGLAAAFEDPKLVEAIVHQKGGIYVVLTQWSGATRQRQVTDWHHLTGPESMAAFAREIRRGGRNWRNYSTAIGEALFHALQVGKSVPEDCKRRVIDVSGDGVNNEGRPPRAIADSLAALGYTVNGLVIRGDTPDPVRFYEINVLAGPRAFLEVAADFDDYPRAILRKLLKEIEQQALVSEADPEP